MTDESMTDELDWRLLDRFLAGECSAPERATVLAWLDAHPFAAQYLEAVKRNLAKRDAKPSPRRRPGTGSSGFRIAAVLVGLAAAVAGYAYGSVLFRRTPPGSSKRLAGPRITARGGTLPSS